MEERQGFLSRIKAKLIGVQTWLRSKEKGQSIVIITGAMVGLIAFTGIVTDVALVYVQYGHLRRAVDAAAVAAAGQMREGRYIDALVDAARETIVLHGLDVNEVKVRVPPYLGGAEHYFRICGGDHEGLLENEDPTMCTDPPRKLVKVTANVPVSMAFLRIVGFDTINLNAEAQGEAATLDVALVLDQSWSMAWDTPFNTETMTGTTRTLACYDNDGTFLPLDCYENTKVCNGDLSGGNQTCAPMEQVLDASLRFLDRLQAPFDRAALVTFDRYATTVVSMTTNLEYVLDILEGSVPTTTVKVYNDEIPCRLAGGGIWECANTNMGMALALANNQFTHWSLRRDDAVWVMIVLSDGGANAAVGVSGYCAEDDECCPSGTRDPDFGPPYCRDLDADTRHCAAEKLADCVMGGLDDPNDWPEDEFGVDLWTYEPTAYDADDFARDIADVVALKSPFGNQIVTFAIGLGDDVVNYDGGDPDAGEKLLRYLANVGYNGEFNDDASDLCMGIGSGLECGNYYFAPDTEGLDRIFEKIASRIFTRITQ
ncbi:MAG: VWA domain-containing protein [Anaerolineales bacterium]|nr:VWA domain-containing protein [Anaerolineales bacterium]